ncbi:hypothetical protein [Streptomyces pseudovenezuelae]|uniref:Small hydrophilic protein n=1 Tax=Streptomyces pseudovenezuelae TaxID=67350 RepID=A0ABT6LLU8_9ACTN|nr:hypothetical protein [Streptomyces pseudovenezuelae]MDH6216769.1 hypothetical protein [Streptomyces pseudovenezuelae]
MTRINRPDTLLTELRDIKRRLHALETAQRTTGNATAETDTPGADESEQASERHEK